MPRERRRREERGQNVKAAPTNKRPHPSGHDATPPAGAPPAVPDARTTAATHSPSAAANTTGATPPANARETARRRISRAPTLRLGARRFTPPSTGATTTAQASEHTTSANAPTAPQASSGRSAGQRHANAESQAPKTTIVLPAAPRELVPVPPPGSNVSSVQAPRTHNTQPIFIRGTRHRPVGSVYRVVPRGTETRSFASQFILALAATVAFCSIIALATPLHATLGISTNVEAYANAVPWVPTPTFTPKPTPISSYSQPAPLANPGTAAIIAEIKSVFGPYATGALNIARCESGYDPNAWNSYPIGNSHASGVFQILFPSTWDGTSYKSLSPFDADANIHAAYQIFSRDGYTWREWACKPY